MRRRIEQGDTVRIVDVREDDEWAKGHVPQAIHIGKGVIERDIENAIPETDTEIVLYCGGGYRAVTEPAGSSGKCVPDLHRAGGTRWER